MGAVPVNNFTIYQGDTFGPREYQWLINGVAPNITGFAVASQIRIVEQSPNIIATFMSVVTDGANGKLSISLTSAETSVLNIPSMHYDIQVSDPSNGKITTIVKGIITLEREVTR